MSLHCPAHSLATFTRFCPRATLLEALCHVQGALRALPSNLKAPLVSEQADPHLRPRARLRSAPHTKNAKTNGRPGAATPLASQAAPHSAPQPSCRRRLPELGAQLTPRPPGPQTPAQKSRPSPAARSARRSWRNLLSQHQPDLPRALAVTHTSLHSCRRAPPDCDLEDRSAACLCAADASTRPRSHQTRGTTDATHPHSTTEGASQAPVGTTRDGAGMPGGAVWTADRDDSAGSSLCPLPPTCAPSRLPAQRSALLLPCTPGFTPLRSPKTARPTPHPDVPATSVSKAKAGQGRPRASPRHQVTPPRPITRPTCTACPSDTQRPGVWSSTRDRAAPRLSPSG